MGGSRLLSPSDAVETACKLLTSSLTSRIAAELRGSSFSELEIALRPKALKSADVIRIGTERWEAWARSWRHFDIEQQTGVFVLTSPVVVRGIPRDVPSALVVRNWSGAGALLAKFDRHDVLAGAERVRVLAARLHEATGRVDETLLSRARGLRDVNVESLMSTLTWLREHPNLGEWTARQLPVPDVDTKWLEDHEDLVRSFIDRDVAAELKPRPAVVHFTYADPAYRATGGRRHDAWTEGDTHSPAYLPSNVVIVENRDCRLHFPPIEDTIIVEGEGKAAGTLVKVDWIRQAERIIYWGDLDSDGFAILSRLRNDLRTRGLAVESMLMDSVAWAKYARFAVNRDKDGNPLKPSTVELPHLVGGEKDCYAILASQGRGADARRVEQERIPMGDAEAELRRLLAR
ncbi:MAG: hypothetical protein BGN97_11085 [Microbacterium sp. 69-10]|uniref:Wadjet anti-phage system protein JetD domain-containing protein n=1 Tax=Microbacterium sp. 69-10 TaxID=1895783 RepID=UPI000960C8B5|nr:Wadjet anti-phage system protein JetD domain-containing protein [Microbacterium sp. 69-10]OJU40384.1 MAG: hypothetical protein BGN97_11085 [Microbacterium sp. 69-10]